MDRSMDLHPKYVNNKNMRLHIHYLRITRRVIHISLINV